MSDGKITPNYLIRIDRVNNNDTFDLDVEMSEQLFADDLKSISLVEKEISDKLRSTLGLGVKVHLVNPKTIARSEGKAKRVLDMRKI
jgi:phenylacetate-CoA ligase